MCTDNPTHPQVTVGMAEPRDIEPRDIEPQDIEPRDIPMTAVVVGNPNVIDGSDITNYTMDITNHTMDITNHTMDITNHTMANLVANTAVPSAENSKKKTPGHLKQQCPHCPEKYGKKYMLQLHIEEAHGENMHCFYCSTSCATKEVLASHIKSVHTEEVKNGKCPICQCKCLGELHQHIVQYHHKDLLTRKSKERVLSTCPICHAATTDAYHLRWHILREHRGLQLPKEIQDGLNEDTGSESGSSVSNEGQDRVADGTKVHDTTSESNGGHKSTTEDQENSKENDLEIVFVSDKNISSDWSKRTANGVPPTSPASKPTANSVPPSSVANDSTSGQCIKKPADSSVGMSPKVDQRMNTQSEVHSTTGQVEQTNERGSPVKYDYHSISEDTCVFCFKTLTKETLSSHLRTDHGWVDTFTCPVCPAKAEKYLGIVEHFCQSHFHPTDEVSMTQCDAKCLKCDIIFQDVSHLKKHASALHSFQLPSEASYNTFKCRHCNIIFEKQFDAQKHFDVYHLFRIRFKCESCRMGFTAKHDFQEHVTCNHPELVKSFCPVCGLGFEVSSDLEEHVFEMHRRKAQFCCAQCGNEFGDRFHVHMHIRSNCCVTWADSNFECLDCLTAFSSISELRIHCKQQSCKQDAKN
jgi:hypothetical protein